jgi:hypothetical protein
MGQVAGCLGTRIPGAAARPAERGARGPGEDEASSAGHTRGAARVSGLVGGPRWRAEREQDPGGMVPARAAQGRRYEIVKKAITYSDS